MPSGRQSPEIIEGADYVEPADLVVQALGFEPEDLPTLWGVPELAVTRWGTIKADFRSHATNLPGVYAAGDIVRGRQSGGLGDPRWARSRRCILAYLAQPARWRQSDTLAVHWACFICAYAATTAD